VGRPQSRTRRQQVIRPRALLAVGLGLAFLAAIPVVTAAGLDNEKQVRICHATSSKNNPYVEDTPAIANNGDLNGGHLNHTGPVFPADDWGDIIPPYPYEDAGGKPQTFPGRNWSSEGQAIYQNGCNPVTPPEPPSPDPITPIFECVEPSGSGFIGHFGYDNPNDTAVNPSSDQNYFSPGDTDRGQPTAFAPGRHDDVVKAGFTGGSITWHLTGNTAEASESSTRCKATITVVKRLVPSTDPGTFDLKIDGKVKATAVGDGGTTDSVTVDAGSHMVSEAGADGTQLRDYETSIRCTVGTSEISREGTSIDVAVARGGSATCLITNQAEEQPKPKGVLPIVECVLFNDGQPDVAYWGYTNTNTNEVSIPVGDRNKFSPGDRDRKQPTTFEKGHNADAVQTTFDASTGTLTWTLSGNTATASSSSKACNPTVEVRKVTIPTDDPGVFQLRINNTVVATGGNGTTAGVLRTGIGEGSVSETAGTGTSLSDYDSKVECSRNGTVEISVAGTKVDGSVAQGDTVVCTFTNTRKGTPPQPPTPPAPPTPPTPNPPPVPPPPPGPTPQLDLVVTKSVEPTIVTVGGRLTWTMTVTNRSSVAAADVNGLKLDDPRSFRTRLISLKPSQGTCRPYTCDLGRLAPGASATVTAVTEATQVGVVVDIVRVGSEEVESNYRNNVAAALARVIGPLKPPTAQNICLALTAEPRALEKGRSSVVRVTARNRLGRPVGGLQVRARGATVDKQARTDRQGVVRFSVTPARLGLLVFTGDRAKAAGPRKCQTRLGVLGAKDTIVTG